VKLFVGDLITLNRLGSQATLHKRLKTLISLGYLKLTTEKDDARKKSITLTKLTYKYAHFMSNCLIRAAK
jgi:hypothetical protein